MDDLNALSERGRDDSRYQASVEDLADISGRSRYNILNNAS